MNAQNFASLKEDIVQVENKVTNKLLKEIEPSLGQMKDEIQTSMSRDLRRIVQEEVALQRMKELKEAEDSAEEDPEKKKNMEDEAVDPGEGTSANKSNEEMNEIQPEKK